MAKVIIVQNWQDDPDIAKAVKGSEDYGTGTALSVHDTQAVQMMQQMLMVLTKIEYHLSLMTDADLEKGSLTHEGEF